ncbi:MAG: hypothetical protein SFY67_05185 [Candidatus Melainabacteria bacterium]|nr:hypothetical protein [Candidatus Melainabacteria bacterium]
MFCKRMVSLALLVSFACQASFAQANLTPRQVYENFKQAEAKHEDISQYMLEPVDPVKAAEAKKKFEELPADQKLALEGLRNAFGAMMPKDQKFLYETVDGDTARLYYGQGMDKEGYTEVVLLKSHGAWKIKGTTFNVNTKPQGKIVNQKTINTAYNAVKKQFPQVPVHGKINGVEFKPARVKLWDTNTLEFGYPDKIIADRSITLWFHFFKGSLINTRMNQTVAPEIASTKGRISVWVEENGKKTKMIDAGDFGIQLALSPKNAQGLVPGYIILQTQDPGTFLEGYFYAKQ